MRHQILDLVLAQHAPFPFLRQAQRLLPSSRSCQLRDGNQGFNLPEDSLALLDYFLHRLERFTRRDFSIFLERGADLAQHQREEIDAPGEPLRIARRSRHRRAEFVEVKREAGALVWLARTGSGCGEQPIDPTHATIWRMVVISAIQVGQSGVWGNDVARLRAGGLHGATC